MAPQHTRRSRYTDLRALGLALALVACSGDSDPSLASGGRTTGGVLLIAVDGLRPDHLSFNGYDRRTTPHIDDLAAESVVFPNTFTTGPFVLPAHTSLMTGCDPLLARRPAMSLPDGSSSRPLTGWFIPKIVPRLAAEFLVAGYETAAFLDHPALETGYGFGPGFRSYHPYTPAQVDGEGVFRDHGGIGRLTDWLDGVDHDQDWFAYLHLNGLDAIWSRPADARAQYFPPRPELSYVPPLGAENEMFHAVPRTRTNGIQYSLGEYESQYDSALFSLDRALGISSTGCDPKGATRTPRSCWSVPTACSSARPGCS